MDFLSTDTSIQLSRNLIRCLVCPHSTLLYPFILWLITLLHLPESQSETLQASCIAKSCINNKTIQIIAVDYSARNFKELSRPVAIVGHRYVLPSIFSSPRLLLILNPIELTLAKTLLLPQQAKSTLLLNAFHWKC
jgi:hypothetical protein